MSNKECVKSSRVYFFENELKSCVYMKGFVIKITVGGHEVNGILCSCILYRVEGY